ncbi:MAG: sulfite exporter TauE/SafE family protein [Candidatus Atabeyarchaeum deiterrae]
MDFLLNPITFVAVFVVVGLCAGLITGIMGGSGVVVVVPILIFLGFPVHVAIGTSLFVDVAASLVASYTYHQHKNIDLSSGVWMALAAVAGAQLGSMLAGYTPAFGLSWGFTVFLILNGLYILKTGMKNVTERISNVARKRLLKGGLNTKKGKRRATVISVVAGLAIGVVSGFIGAGGGIMFLLVLLFVLGYELHVAIGTSTLVMAITATSGAAGYYLRGNLDLLTAVIISIGTLASSRMGALAANRLGVESLGRVIGIIFIALGLMMLFPLVV